tara:strand:- start:240 stop:1208 length:969 start_codon:yes stop_codon:yes gene_type:complete
MKKQQTVRGIPHWGKFRKAAKDIDILSKNVVPIEVQQLTKVTSLLIEKSPKFYVPDIANILTKEDYLFSADEYLNLPFPIIALLSETHLNAEENDSPADHVSKIAGHPATDRERMRENIKRFVGEEGADSWKISLFTQPEKNGPVAVISSVLDPMRGTWVCMPLSARIEKHQLGVYAGTFGGDPATAKILKDMSDEDAQLVLNDFGDDICALMALSKLLGIHNAKTIKVPVPPKLVKKHHKKNDYGNYDYHVLEIGGEVWDSPYVMGGGSGGKRSHLRRGHIRRLENKNVWVRAAYVHGSVEGFVDKDYIIKGGDDDTGKES